MSDNIEISYSWDRDTYIEASKLAYDYELKNSKKKYFGWLFIALTQFGVVAAMKQGSIGLLLISTILVLYWYMLRWPLRKRFIEKTFDKLANADSQYTIATSPDNLIVNNEDIVWRQIDSVLVLKEGLFLYLNQNSIYIPNKAFDDIEQRSDFLKILKQNITNYTKES